jgi:molybdopterin-containing oxidoreductase family membrane subunit
LYRAYLIGSREAQWYFLFGGAHSAVFWFGLMFMGVFIPAVILFSPAKNSIKMINVAAILHVIGVLCERYIIVVPGQTHPADILPNMQVESAALLTEKVGYSISFLEAVQALGIAAMVAIAFVLGLRIFAMLPTKALIENETTSEEAASTG